MKLLCLKNFQSRQNILIKFHYLCIKRYFNKYNPVDVLQIQRKWRQKELETARRKQQETKLLKNIRDQQIREKRKNQTSLIDEKKKEAEKIAAENETLKSELTQQQQQHMEVKIE